MTIWMLPVVFVGGLLLTVLLLAIARWAGEFLGDSPHVGGGPAEEGRTWRRHQSR